MPLLTPRVTYKPLEYQFAFDAYKLQNQIHWGPGEVPLADDVKDWQTRLTDNERHLLTQLFRFFTQADVDVSENYVFNYLTAFGHIPEIRMMLVAFANMESVHMHAYSLLLDTIGMPETEYSAFMEYEAMKNKHDFLGTFNMDNPQEMAKTMAIISGFIEGVQLFSSFIILLNFTRFGKMKGTGQIIAWSVRDETLHVNSLSKLFRVFVQENPKIWNNKLKRDIYDAAEEIVRQEDAFIDLCFEFGDIEGLTPADVKKYIRYITDRRLIGLGLKGIFKHKTNPLPWVDYILNGQEFGNFFEVTVTQYSRGATQGHWHEVWEKFDKSIQPSAD